MKGGHVSIELPQQPIEQPSNKKLATTCWDAPEIEEFVVSATRTRPLSKEMYISVSRSKKKKKIYLLFYKPKERKFTKLFSHKQASQELIAFLLLFEKDLAEVFLLL